MPDELRLVDRHSMKFTLKMPRILSTAEDSRATSRDIDAQQELDGWFSSKMLKTDAIFHV